MNKRLPDAATKREPVKRFPPQAPTPYAGTWRPVMTEQQKREHEKYVAENNLPF